MLKPTEKEYVSGFYFNFAVIAITLFYVITYFNSSHCKKC